MSEWTRLFSFCVLLIAATSPLTQAQSVPSFAPAVTYNSGGSAAGMVAVADVNGDGKPDIIVANTCSVGTPSPSTCTSPVGSMGVLLGNGDGTFQAASTYETSGPMNAFAVADVNGDGKPDLVVAECTTNTCATGKVEVLLGNGAGGFQSSAIYPVVGFGPGSIAVADVNGDGIPDLLVASPYAAYAIQMPFSGIVGVCPGLVGVFIGKGDGTFQPETTYVSGGCEATVVAVADVNGDGIPDLVVTNCSDNTTNPDCTEPGAVDVLLGKGDGTFEPAVSFASGGYGPGPIAIADVNGDGLLDLLVSNSCSNGLNCVAGSVGVLLGKGDGTFQPTISYGSGGYGRGVEIAVADLNGDGNLDIVVMNLFASDTSTSDTIGVLLGNGNGTFQPALTYPTGYLGEGLAVADVNGDHRPDVVVSNAYVSPTNYSYGTVGVLINTTGTASSAAVASSLNPSVVDQTVEFTAAVTAQGGTPTGNVTFHIGANKPVTVPLTNGQAIFNWTFAFAGSRTVTAVYSGDETYAPSISAPLTQTVNAAVVTISGSPLQPLTQNEAGDYVALVTITNTGNVTVSSLQVTVAGTALGSGSLTSAPAAVTNLAPGASAVVTLTFPASSVSPGAMAAPLKVSGTYLVTSPSLSGNWGLSFRSVTL